MSTRSSQKAIQSAELLAHCSSYDPAFESTETKYGSDATGTSRVGAAQTTESAGLQLEGIVLRLKRQQAPQPRRLRPTSERSSNTLLSSSYHVMTNSKKSPEVSRQSEPSRLQSIPQVCQSSPKMCNSRGNSGIPGCLDATIDAVVQASHAIRPDVRMCSRQQTSGSRQSPREVVVSNEWAEAVEAFIEATDFVVPNKPFLEVLSEAAEQRRLKHRLQERERRARLLPTAKQAENLARQHAIRDAVMKDTAAGLLQDNPSSSMVCVMRKAVADDKGQKNIENGAMPPTTIKIAQSDRPEKPLKKILAEQRRLKHKLQIQERIARLHPERLAKQAENLARQHAIRDAVMRDAAAGILPDLPSTSLLSSSSSSSRKAQEATVATEAVLPSIIDSVVQAAHSDRASIRLRWRQYRKQARLAKQEAIAAQAIEAVVQAAHADLPINRQRRTSYQTRRRLAKKEAMLLAETAVIIDEVISDTHELAGSLVCAPCRLSFSCADALDAHRLRHLISGGDGPDSIVSASELRFGSRNCQFCRQRFAERRKLHAHYYQRYIDGSHPLPSLETLRKMDRKIFICDQCGTKCNRLDSFEYHVRHFHGTIFDKTLLQNGQTVGKSSTSPGDGNCDDVGSKTRGLSTTSCGPGEFFCAQCGRGFATKNNLAKHVPVHKDKAKVSGGLPCSYCGKQLASKNSLKEHERIHTGERPFQCQFCPKTFRAQVSLLFHERAHLGDKRYKCNLCPRSFLQRSILDYHLTTHSGERPVKCEPCGKAFPTRPAWRLHCKTQRHKDRLAGGAAKKSTTAERGGQKVFLDLSDRLNPRMEVVNQ